MKKYSIGLDLGTSSVKAVLFDGKKVLDTDSAQFDIYDSKTSDGSVYKGFSAKDFAEKVFGVISNLAKKVDGNIYGISMASASGNTLLLNEKNEPLLDAYSWTNSPFIKECETVYGKLTSKNVAEISGWAFFNTFPLSHLAHIKLHYGDLLKNCTKVCMTTEYLLFLMTGKWGIDRSTAVPFYLLEQKTGKWHKEYLDKLEITEDKLLPVYNSGDLLGEITDVFAKKYGINKNAKVFLGSFDHPSGAKSNKVKKEGDLLLSCGTSWVGFFPTKNRQKVIDNNLLCDTFMADKGVWGAMFSIPQISAPIDKLIENNISKSDKIKMFNECAKKSLRGANGLRINPVADYEKDYSKYDKNDIARAIMEGAAYLLKEKIDELEKQGFKFKKIKMAGGPSKSEIWREIIEYILGKKVYVTYGVNSGAVGAAIRALGK